MLIFVLCPLSVWGTYIQGEERSIISENGIQGQNELAAASEGNARHHPAALDTFDAATHLRLHLHVLLGGKNSKRKCSHVPKVP